MYLVQVEVNANLNELVGIMKAKEQPEVAVEESVTLTKAQFNDLRAELSAGK